MHTKTRGMTRHRGEAWSSEDLQELDDLVREQVPLSDIRKKLGRTTAGIKHALRNIVYQRLFVYEPEEIAEYYGVDMDSLSDDLVPSKFYLPMPLTEETPEIVANKTSEIGWWMTGMLFVGTGVFTYLKLLHDNWHHIQHFAYD